MARNAGRTRIPEQPRSGQAHAHKFDSGRAHRYAHKLERQEVERARIKAISRHPQRRRVVRSEWLDRQPGSAVAAGFKQPGRRFGPAVIGSGLGPREGAHPLLPGQRERHYPNHRSNPAGPMTPRQAKRARQKAHTGVKKDA
jgi:hypothetical protein